MIALAIGLAVVGLASTLTGAISDLGDEWIVFLILTLMVAAPFGALATMREGGRAAWLTAGALTVAFWGLLLADAFIREGEGGANIGFGLLMFVSPLVIIGGAMIASGVSKRHR